MFPFGVTMEIPDPHVCLYVVNGGYLVLHVTRDTEDEFGTFQMSTMTDRDGAISLVGRVLAEWEGPSDEEKVPDSLKEFTKKSRKAHDE